MDIAKLHLDIVMVVGGLEITKDVLEKRSLGGSESAGIYMAKALAKQGHVVTLFCNTPKVDLDEGVRYLPIQSAREYTQSIPHDVLIVQRDPEYFMARQASKINILWQHDLAAGRNAGNFKGVLWNIDRVALLSKFMVDQYKDVYKIPESCIFKTTNGVDIELVNSIPEQKRNLKQLVYTARPERGLDVVLTKILPEILRQDPEYTLVLASYHNPVESMGAFYTACENVVKQYGDRITIAGNLTKAQLYTLYKQSGCYIYPTPSPVAPEFAEVSCITAMEAQACGLPIVCSDVGALAETVKFGSGELIKRGDGFERRFVDAVMRITKNVTTHSAISNTAKRNAAPMSWDAVADQWRSEFANVFKAKTSDKYRLAKHFIRQSDIMTAREIVKENGFSDLQEWLDEWFYFIDPQDGFKNHYAKIIHTIYHKEQITQCVNEPRFPQLSRFISAHPDIENVLDYASTYGNYTTNLAAQHKGLNFIGVDIDVETVKLGNKFSKEILGDNANCKFLVGDINDKMPEVKKQDLLIAQEILEHVAEPWTLIDSLEQYVNDDGYVYVSVPFGPWEYDSYYNYPNRCHIWHFEKSDLLEMFGDKKDLAISAIQGGASQLMREPLGWWVVTYRKSDAKAHKPNRERKELLQSPRETVSANIIAGPNAEDQLHWVLKPLVAVVDEIILVDNGISEECRRIAKVYGAKIVPGADPRSHGFETPRNIGVAASKMDWILWIDTDERLVDAENLHKYLRANSFDGYSIRQHHFACDTTFPADMPVRLFRNNAGMKFFGMIHEHPEKALNEGPGGVVVISDVNIAHTGYLAESIRRGRFSRNYPMLMADIEKYPNRLLQKHFIMRDNMLLVNYEMQQNGGNLTASAVDRCKLVIATYNEHFKGKPNPGHIDGMEWYTQAMTILNRGLEVEYIVKVNGDASKPVKARFETLEDARADIANTLTSVGEKFESKYF